jgi:hypothetical protein
VSLNEAIPTAVHMDPDDPFVPGAATETVGPAPVELRLATPARRRVRLSTRLGRWFAYWIAVGVREGQHKTPPLYDYVPLHERVRRYPE